MLSWFRSRLPPHQTGLAMLGVKAGQEVLFLGAAEPDLAAEVARITGLNGRTVLAEPDGDARRRVESAAGRVGTLIEYAAASPAGVPDVVGTFDVVAITTRWTDLRAGARRELVEGAFAAARPGGRIVGVLSTGRKPLVGRPGQVPREIAREALALLSAAGSRAVRVLGEVPGTTYVEGVRPRVTEGT